MTFKEWADRDIGRRSRLARALKVSVSLVSMWVNARRPVPANWCLEIEHVTKGEVTAEMLRPDLHWVRFNPRQAGKSTAAKKLLRGRL